MVKTGGEGEQHWQPYFVDGICVAGIGKKVLCLVSECLFFVNLQVSVFVLLEKRITGGSLDAG